MDQKLDLQVVLRVPVGVEDDAGVGGGEVDAQASGAGAQQEDEAVRVWLAEAVDGRLAQVPPHSTVDALVQVSGQNRRTFIPTLLYGSSSSIKPLTSLKIL